MKLIIVCVVVVIICSGIFYYNQNPIALVVGLWCACALLSVGLADLGNWINKIK